MSARDLLGKENHRLSLALGLLFCLSVTVGCFFFLFAGFDLVFGRASETWSYQRYYLAYNTIIFLSVLLSLPAYHGYRICVGNLARTGVLNLWDLFYPYSAPARFFSSLFVALFPALPYGITFCLQCASALNENIWLMLLAYAVFPLCYFLAGYSRRVCRLHACFADRGLRFALRMARMCPGALKRMHIRLSFGSFPHLLLSIATVFIYGVYGAFAQFALSSSLLYLQSIEIIDSRKDIQP